MALPKLFGALSDQLLAGFRGVQLLVLSEKFGRP